MPSAACILHQLYATDNGPYNVFCCVSYLWEGWQENHTSTKTKYPNQLTALFRVAPVRQKVHVCPLRKVLLPWTPLWSQEASPAPLSRQRQVHLLLPCPCSLTAGSFHHHIFNYSPEWKATKSERKPFPPRGLDPAQ